MMNKLLLLIIISFMISCNGKETKPSQNKNDKFKIDTLEFISYKDKNDEAYFVVKEDDKNLSFEFPDSIDNHLEVIY